MAPRHFLDAAPEPLFARRQFYFAPGYNRFSLLPTPLAMNQHPFAQLDKSLPFGAGAIVNGGRVVALGLNFLGLRGSLYFDGDLSGLESYAFLARLLLKLKQTAAALFEVGGELFFLLIEGEAPLFQAHFLFVQRRLLSGDGGRLDAHGIALGLRGSFGRRIRQLKAKAK
jgi:hypothetical protein